MKEQLVSVIIPTYKRPDKLKRALESVLNQEYKTLEIIVVDDNGKNTLEQIATTNIVISLKDNRLRKIDHSSNKGGCAARNTGIKNASGSFIGFLDDDDEWQPSFISKVMHKFEKSSSNVGAIYTSLILKNHRYKLLQKVDVGLYNENVHDKIKSGWCPISTSLFVIKKECFEYAGLFDEKLKSFQDFDMWLRISKKFNFDYVDEELVVKNQFEGEQVSVNPDTRSRGLETLVDKWRKEYTEEEIQYLINKFSISIYENYILKYLIEKDKKTARSFFKNYLQISDNKRRKLVLCGTIIFGKWFYDLIMKINIKLKGNKISNF